MESEHDGISIPAKHSHNPVCLGLFENISDLFVVDLAPPSSNLLHADAFSIKETRDEMAFGDKILVI